MIADEIKSRVEAVVAVHGPWTAHRIELGHGFATLPIGYSQQWRVEYLDALLRRFAGPLQRGLAGTAVRLKRRFFRRHFYSRLNILDLACLEGLFTLEFGRLGASTVGLEIRDAHLAKAEVARDILGLNRVRLVHGDVREIPPDLGAFDIIICAGILYHLDFPDCVRLLESITRRSRDLIIIDSHLAYENITDSVLPLSEMRDYSFGGRTYRGRAIIEHAPNVSAEEKVAVHVWASIDNEVSVWLSEPDVIDVMFRSGFKLVYRGYGSPSYKSMHPDRPTLVFKRSLV